MPRERPLRFRGDSSDLESLCVRLCRLKKHRPHFSHFTLTAFTVTAAYDYVVCGHAVTVGTTAICPWSSPAGSLGGCFSWYNCPAVIHTSRRQRLRWHGGGGDARARGQRRGLCINIDICIDMCIRMRVDMCIGSWSRTEGQSCICHNYIGHNYRGHNYRGHNYIGCQGSAVGVRRPGQLLRALHGRAPFFYCSRRSAPTTTAEHPHRPARGAPPSPETVVRGGSPSAPRRRHAPGPRCR